MSEELPKWHYPKDRVPTDAEYGADLRTNQDFLKVGPRFTAHLFARQQKEVQGVVDPAPIREQLLGIFCPKDIDDAAMRHFDDIAIEAYLHHR